MKKPIEKITDEQKKGMGMSARFLANKYNELVNYLFPEKEERWLPPVLQELAENGRKHIHELTGKPAAEGERCRHGVGGTDCRKCFNHGCGWEDEEPSQWEKAFSSKFFVYDISGEYPEHVGAEKDAIEFIRNLLATNPQETSSPLADCCSDPFQAGPVCGHCGKEWDDSSQMAYMVRFAKEKEEASYAIGYQRGRESALDDGIREGREQMKAELKEKVKKLCTYAFTEEDDNNHYYRHSEIKKLFK